MKVLGSDINVRLACETQYDPVPELRLVFYDLPLVEDLIAFAALRPLDSLSIIVRKMYLANMILNLTNLLALPESTQISTLVR